MGEPGEEGVFCIGYFFQQQQIRISLTVIWNVQRNTAIQGRLTAFKHGKTDMLKEKNDCFFLNNDYTYLKSVNTKAQKHKGSSAMGLLK